MNFEWEYLVESPNVSCILVYQEYGSDILLWEQCPQTTNILSKELDDPSKYDFVLFGKNDTYMDERPKRFTQGIENILKFIRIVFDIQLGRENNIPYWYWYIGFVAFFILVIILFLCIVEVSVRISSV